MHARSTMCLTTKLLPISANATQRHKTLKADKDELYLVADFLSGYFYFREAYNSDQFDFSKHFSAMCIQLFCLNFNITQMTIHQHFRF